MKAYTSDSEVFSDKQEAAFAFAEKSRDLHAKLDGKPGWQSKRFETLDEAIEFFKDSHPYIAASLRRQNTEIKAYFGQASGNGG